MDDDEEIGFETDHNSLAEAADVDDAFASEIRWRRIDGAQHEWIAEAELEQRLIDDAFRDRLDVYGNVRQLGHCGIIAAPFAFIEPTCATRSGCYSPASPSARSSRNDRWRCSRGLTFPRRRLRMVRSSSPLPA